MATASEPMKMISRHADIEHGDRYVLGENMHGFFFANLKETKRLLAVHAPTLRGRKKGECFGTSDHRVDVFVWI